MIAGESGRTRSPHAVAARTPVARFLHAFILIFPIFRVTFSSRGQLITVPMVSAFTFHHRLSPFRPRVNWVTSSDAELVLGDRVGKEAFVEIVRLARDEAVRREPGERGWRHMAEHIPLAGMVRCYRSIFCQDRRERWPDERSGS